MKCEVIRNCISGEAWQVQGDTRREARLLGIWNWELHTKWAWAWNFPWCTPRRVWRSSRKYHLKRYTQGVTTRWPSEHRT